MAQLIDIECAGPAYFGGRADFASGVYINGNQIYSLEDIFPVNAIYFCATSSLPPAIKNLGTWQNTQVTLNGVTYNLFKRTA